MFFSWVSIENSHNDENEDVVSNTKIVIIIEILLNSGLIAVHFNNLFVIGAVIWLLVWSLANESREPKSDTLVLLISETGCVHWTQRKVCCFDFPHISRLKVNVAFYLRKIVFDLYIVWRLIQGQFFQFICKIGELLIREACSNLSNRLEYFNVFVPARNQERTEPACSLSLAVISADDNEVNCVTHALIEIILLQLEPIEWPFRWLVSCIHVQRLDH